ILRELDAAAVGLDVVFREPSNPQVPPSVRAQLNSPELGAELREFLEPDALLAQELSRTDRVVLGTVLTAEHPPRFSTRLTDSNAVNDLSMPGEGASISNIAVATEWHGVLNVPMDADGAIRRHSRTYDGYGSLAAVLVERVQPGSVNWDSQGIVLLRLLDPESFERVRLSDLLRGREAFREVIEGRVVLIGADSELDRRVLYGAYRVPGVLVHATAVDNLLHGEQWQMDGMAAWLGALLTFLCHIAIGLGLERGGVARAVSMIAAVVVLFCTAWLVAFLSAGWVWVTLPAALGGVALVGAGISRRWERARRGRLILAERVERDRLVTATVAHTADGVLVTDQSFSVRYSNHAARMLLQLDSHAPSLAGLSDELRLDTGELTLSRAEDSGLAERFVAFVRSDMRLEGELHWIYTLRDVTETRELERLKAQLVSSMSHELKNPLTSIHAALKMMQAGILGDMPQASRGSLNAASAASERMVRLIDDTLEAERRSDSDLQIRVQAVESWNDLVSSAVALHDLTAAQASVELVFSPGEDTELWVDS
ncbi:MAG: CHASE2 domain-containing protein, partial [Myxococcota bacterium]